jgi:hypothetical protein
MFAHPMNDGRVAVIRNNRVIALFRTMHAAESYMVAWSR